MISQNKMTEMEDLRNIEKLRSAEEFPVWKFQVEIIFKSIGIFGIVNGKETLAANASESLKTEFEKKDAKAQRIIITTIDRKPLTH